MSVIITLTRGFGKGTDHRKSAFLLGRSSEIPNSCTKYGAPARDGKRGDGYWFAPASVDLGGPLFAEGAGAKESLTCLPLAEGYSTTYRNFDVQKQKVQLMQLKVTGMEKVTVPAGTFDTYKLEITSDGDSDKETLWVAKDTHKPVKESPILSSMGGAVLTQELMP
ncbi:MAG TPA: hypothetical protein VGN44_01385 [Candidatus Angelobacter sp.]